MSVAKDAGLFLPPANRLADPFLERRSTITPFMQHGLANVWPHVAKTYSREPPCVSPKVNIIRSRSGSTVDTLASPTKLNWSPEH
eukprot:2738456-Amphidinium_carterae.1